MLKMGRKKIGIWKGIDEPGVMMRHEAIAHYKVKQWCHDPKLVLMYCVCHHAKLPEFLATITNQLDIYGQYPNDTP